MTTETTETTETTISDDREGQPVSAAELYVVAMSPDRFATYPIPSSGILSIGRSSHCQIHLEDPLVSREHARLYVEARVEGPAFSVEDAGSANGTGVHDVQLERGARAEIRTGEAVKVGSTVLMVTHLRGTPGPRRLWSHAYFEACLDGECSLLSGGASRSFALLRVRFSGAAAWTKVLPILARDLGTPHVFAAYGPRDYEILLLGLSEPDVDAMIAGVERECREAGLDPRFAVAWYPRDGRNGDTLLAVANAHLKVRAAEPAGKVSQLLLGGPMQRVRALATRVAASPINILILGECGVGKDVLARLIHELSPRAPKPFVAFNCAALSEGVLESELFGHDRGSFSGATGSKVGLLEHADGGTVFLDEIGDMPKGMQAKLLRATENREIKPVGSVKPRTIDVRFISATNKDLDAAVSKDDFRRDLLDRLNTMTLVVPPLRERTDEILDLAKTFLTVASKEMGRDEALSLGADVLPHLMRYRWPGNIRELKNVMERAVALCDGPEIHAEHLPLEKMGGVATPQLSTRGFPTSQLLERTQSLPTLTDPKQFAERQKIVDALAACRGNQTRAADLLKMPRRTFVSKLDHFGIPRPQKGWQVSS